MNVLSPHSDRKRGWISAFFWKNKINLSNSSSLWSSEKRGFFMPRSELNRSIAQGEFGKSVFPMSCRQDRQGHRRHKDEDFVLTAHKDRLPCALGRTGSFRPCPGTGQPRGGVRISHLRRWTSSSYLSTPATAVMRFWRYCDHVMRYQ